VGLDSAEVISRDVCGPLVATATPR